MVSTHGECDKACEKVHNKLRNLHGSQPLVWSEELGDEAQKWCDYLALSDELEHDNKTMDKNNQGQNFGAVSGVGKQTKVLLQTCASRLLSNGTARKRTTTTRQGYPKLSDCQSITLHRSVLLVYVCYVCN